MSDKNQNIDNDTLDRSIMVNAIIDGVDSLSDNEVNELYIKIINKPKKRGRPKKVIKTAKVSKNIKVVPEDKDEKMDIILKVMNNLLKALGSDEIDDILDFKIRRDDLVSQTAIDSVESEYDGVFKHRKLFKRQPCGWYYRKTLQFYHITFLKGIVSQTDKYAFISKRFRTEYDDHTAYVVIKK
jgi:hypothetical protein